MAAEGPGDAHLRSIFERFASGLVPFPIDGSEKWARGGTGRQAGVLALVWNENGQYQILITERAATLRHHAGQGAFPGGKRDPEDPDIIACALRETREEVGLHVDRAQVVGVLSPLVSKHGLDVFCVVAHTPVSPMPALVLSEAEVAAAFSAPLALFLDDSPAHSSTPFTIAGTDVLVHSFAIPRRDGAEPPHVVWGLTAFFCIGLAKLILGREPKFPLFPAPTKL